MANSQTHWIPLSDLMTGLMMVFMLIAVSYMVRVEQTTTLVIKEYKETKNNLTQALQKEFSKDLKQWDAEILGDMTIRFDNPETLFDIGSAAVKPAFKEILSDFIPRYIALVSSPKYKNSVKEVRIEGHTSKIWGSYTDEKIAYIKNMKLSQERAQSILEYVLSLDIPVKTENWIRQHLTSSGFSSSKPILEKDEQINNERSQRVEFVIITNSDSKIEDIFKKLENG